MFPSDDACRKLLLIPKTATVNIMQSMLQPCPPWTLRAWPPILWQVGRQGPGGLQHLGTQVTHSVDTTAGTTGQTLWGTRGSKGALGFAWDWVQLGDGVLAMADPMAVVTNLRLVGTDGDLLTPYASARHFCAMVHALPWQQAVQHAVVQARDTSAAARRMATPLAA